MIDNGIPVCVCVSTERLFQTQQKQRIVLTGRKSLLCWTGTKFVSTRNCWAQKKKPLYTAYSMHSQRPTCLCPFLLRQTKCVESQRHDEGIQSSPVLSCLAWLGKGSALRSALQSLANEQRLVLSQSVSPLLGQNKICLHQMRRVGIVLIARISVVHGSSLFFSAARSCL